MGKQKTRVRPFAFSHRIASNQLRKHSLKRQSNHSRRGGIKGEGGFSSLHYGSRGGAVNPPLHTADGLPFSHLAVHSFAQGQLLAQGKSRLNLCYADF